MEEFSKAQEGTSRELMWRGEVGEARGSSSSSNMALGGHIVVWVSTSLLVCRQASFS